MYRDAFNKVFGAEAEQNEERENISKAFRSFKYSQHDAVDQTVGSDHFN